MARRGLELFTMDRIRKTADWMDRVVGELLERVYVTIDLDGLDPAFCPGVGTPEPGGLSWPDLLELLRKVFSRRRVIGADVVECLPLPGNPMSEFLAARLAYKLIGYRYKLRPRP
jgi:agmatinase